MHSAKIKQKTTMENKTEWYKKLERKLQRIKSGELDLDDYIQEVNSKIEVGNKALDMSGVKRSAFECGICGNGVVEVVRTNKGPETSINVEKCTNCRHKYGLKGVSRLKRC